MKKKLLLPLVLSSAALILAGCNNSAPTSSTPASSASSEPVSSELASSEPASVESSEPVSSEEPLPVYDYAMSYAEPDGWDSIVGVPGGSTGASSLVGESVEKKTQILGALEKYAVDHYITGLPLFENGGYVMYNPRVVKGTENYITGYGFGILREGKLASELPGSVAPTYYHTYEASDPQKINYLDDSGSQIGDLFGNVATSYFGTKMGEDKTKYDWYGLLSTKDRPVQLTAEGEIETDTSVTTSKKWRIYVRTGAEGGVAYRTASEIASRKAFDGKPVELEDYLNAFRILLCGQFAYYRGNELAGQTGYSGIAGASAYYNASKAGIDSDAAKAAFENIGIQAGTDEDGDYLDFELLTPASRFYAMYSLASSLYSPINMDFFKLVTEDFEHPEFYGAFNTDKTASPVDNFLSTGPFYLESWQTDKAITFARNDEWYERKENNEIYNIPGIYEHILPAVNTDADAAIKEFLIGNIDAASIPTDYLSRFKNDPRTTKVPGTSVFKLNLNTTTQEQWIELFGENGTISTTSESNYWNVKPWMSNDDFVKGLFFSIDRNEFADKQGSIPSIDYFSSNYMSDPEGGVSYNATQVHKDAISEFWGDTVETGGFDKNLATGAFDDAVKGLLEEGTIEENQELTIDIWWMYQQHITRYGADIAKYIQDAFNAAPSALASGITLKVNNEAVDVWSDVYYKHLMVGQFDLGFGSISGNSLDPLNFMEVLKSDNSSGFTLNWGPDTSALDLEFEGEIWSFDNLWGATDHGIATYKGQSLPPVVVEFGKAEFSEYGDLILTFTVQTVKSWAAERAEEDEDWAKLAAVSDEEYSSQLDAAYISDGATYEILLGFDEEGNAVLDDDYVTMGLLADFSLTEQDGLYEVEFVITQDLLLYTADEDVAGGLYYGAKSSQTVAGVTSEADSYGLVMFADSSAMA